MAIPAAYAQYNNSKVLTASPAELTLMLYEGAIKFCNIAIMAIEKKDIEKSHINIVKVENIINYLQSTLDTKYPVSEDYDRIYTYLQQRLAQANIRKPYSLWFFIRLVSFFRDLLLADRARLFPLLWKSNLKSPILSRPEH